MKIKTIIYAFICVSLLSFTSTDSVTEDEYIGDWALVAEQTPQGDMAITMTIDLVDEVYTAKLVSEEGDIPLENVSIKEAKFVGSFNYQEGDFELTGTFDGDEFKGEIYGMDTGFTTNGKRIVKE